MTKAWFPFSTNPSKDRYIVVGSEEHKRRDIREAPFSELVAMGEEIIDTERLDDHFTIHIDDDTLPAHDTPQRAPRMLAGFRGRAELSAKWSPDAITHFKDGEGRRRWTRELFGGLREARAIGGSVEQFGHTFEAGGPPLSSSDFFVDAAYSAIEDVEKERDLILPQPPPATGPTCEVSQAPPTRADAVRWRKKFFEDDCSAQPATPHCLTQRAIYRAFVAQQLGAVDLQSLPTASPELRDRYRNQLVVILKPMLVPNTERSLVVPVFTFPDQTSYAEDVDLGSALDHTRSVIAKIGEFGSAGVTSVNVTAGGDLYDVNNPPEVVFTGGNGSGARGIPVIENAAIKGVTIVDGGHDYDAAPRVDFATTHGSGAVATAAIGPSQPRKLPWVDADVIWNVRIGWRVPLRGSRIERPLELAAVREFRLFRSERDECGNEVKRRLATLRRPGFDTLDRIDLDQVEFVWIDAITDRDLHEFTYSIVAVPEDCNTFREQEWYSLKVNVPDSRIAARPESARYLPMLAKQDGSGTTRSLAVYFSDAAVRSNADRVSYFFARAADDPMLSIKPVAKVDGGRAPFIPTRWEQVFPANRIAVQ
ncbi:MAG TPA: hypothetical protein VNG89_12465, partial [Vicinamibacterales bacterium]|nr:hypothetical protein [Vicinamibacterales bacterium]